MIDTRKIRKMTTPVAEPVNGDMTVILRQMAGGDRAAQERLFEMAYLDLRRMARAIAARERGGVHQPTEVLNEAISRLWGARNPVHYEDRKHFFRTVARTMRRVLIDLHKGANRHALDPITSTLPGNAPNRRAQEMSEALDELAAIDPRSAEVIEYRYYIGLERLEIAEILGLSERTVTRDLQFAKLWLAARLKQ